MKFHLSKNPERQKDLLAAKAYLEKALQGVVDDNTVVTLGGDGTLLGAIAKYGTDYMYMPLNFGTRGYLTCRTMDLAHLVEMLVAGEVRAQAFRCLTDGKHIAFNEMSFAAAGGQATEMAILIDDHPFVVRPLVGSGLVVHTTQGSTGLACSLGATCQPADALPSIGIVAMAPYSPRLPPVIIPQNAKVEIIAINAEYRSVVQCADGVAVRQLNSKEPIVLTHAPDPIVVLYPGDHDFLRRMLSKVLYR